MFWRKKTGKALNETRVRNSLDNPDWLSGVRISRAGRVTLIMEVDGQAPDTVRTWREMAEKRLLALTGVSVVNTVLTAERGLEKRDAEREPEYGFDSAKPERGSEKPRPRPGMQRVRKGARLSDKALAQGHFGQREPLAPIPGIARIMVVASAKGGVGKSTIAVNLAAAFARKGLQVGLLDADIYGPSMPVMLGADTLSPVTNAEGKLVPVKVHGLYTLSIGYLADRDAPMIWRGPMVQSAIGQMLHDTDWQQPDGPLDLLIIDTPPGTGEAQLVLAQKVPVNAALIVTTPQEVALADVRRGAGMFVKTGVPVLGIIETMSWFDAPDGKRYYPMGQGGAERMAASLNLKLIGQLPLLDAIRAGGDCGVPAVFSDDQVAHCFTDFARTLALALDAQDDEAKRADA